MNKITSFVKHEFNINEEIISNNMILFASVMNKIGKYTNGYLMLDVDNFNTPQHALIYNLISSVTDKHDINLDDYYIVMRSRANYGRDYFDMYSGYGEYHDIITPDGTIISDCCDFRAQIYYNNWENGIIIGTDLNKNNKETITKINEITLIRPRMMSMFVGSHFGEFAFTDSDHISKDKLMGGFYSTTLEFFNKCRGKLNVNYSNFSAIEDEEELYKYYENYHCFKNKERFVNNSIDTKLENIELVANTQPLITQSSYDNDFVRNLLDSRNYTFETLYKSLYPGEYPDENFEIKHYDKCYSAKATTLIENINQKNHDKCVGYQTVPAQTKEIISELCNYMEKNNVYSMTIIE